MLLVNQSYQITRWDPEVDLREICDGARLCYKSADLESREAQEQFIFHLINLVLVLSLLYQKNIFLSSAFLNFY